MSLDLDDRQRAMLQEMQVHVWWPRTAEAMVQALAPEPVTASPAPVRQGNAPQRGAPMAVQGAAATPPATIAANPPAPGSGARSKDQGIASMDWQALQQAVATCRACPLCEARKNTVFGMGAPAVEPRAAPQVDWLVVGEAPDDDEDRSGKPFAGQAGQLLDNMFKAMGVNRQQNVFLLSVVKCRPPGNRNPEAQEIAQCEPFLRRQIELLQPKIILALGRHAAVALLQDSVPDVRQQPPGKLRGRLHHYSSNGRKVPVVASFSPTHLLRNQTEKAKAWADLCFAMDVLRRSG